MKEVADLRLNSALLIAAMAAPAAVNAAPEHVLPAGYRPKPGDEITGRLWLQGYLVED